jgi:hypothetical protein
MSDAGDVEAPTVEVTTEVAPKGKLTVGHGQRSHANAQSPSAHEGDDDWCKSTNMVYGKVT